MEEKIKKRVLFLITQSELGGAQRFLYELISRLDPDKYAMSIAAGSDGDKEFLSALAKINTNCKILKYLKREVNLFNDVRAVFELRGYIRKVSPDILFLNSSKAGFIGSLAAVFPKKIRNLKVIYRIGGWTFNDPWPKWKKRLWVILEKISARWKDVIIVNNKHDFIQAQELKIIPKEKIKLVHNGIDTYKINFLPASEARLKLFEKIARYSGKIFQTKTLVGTVANLYPAKGLDYLLSAASHFKNDDDIAFVVIGDGPERAKIEKTITEKGLSKKVFLVGRLPEASQYLTAFDIFVLPSVKEGFPWSVLEAMAAKVPVIATRVGAVPEIIEDGKNGFLVEPENPQAIAEKIKEIQENDYLKQELGIQGHQTVLFKFGADQMVKEIEYEIF